MTTTDLSEFHTPGRGRGIFDVFYWRYLLGLLVRKGTQTRYRNSVLGWTWSYVKPAAQFSVYYLVMGIFLQFHRDIEYFAVYLFSGIVIVNFFNEAFGNATRAITENRALVKKIYLPRELFPIAAVIGALIHFLPQGAILLVVCILLGWTPTFTGLVMIAAAVAIIALISLGLGLFFGALNVVYRDAQNFVEIIQVFSTWSVPVLYTYQMVQSQTPGWFYDIYMANPLAAAVELMHQAMWRPITDSPFPPPEGLVQNGLISLVVCAVSLVVGQWVFRRLERRFAQEL